MQYLCQEHAQDQNYELYPISQVHVLEDHPGEGVEILRRGKRIEEAAKLLRAEVAGLEARLQICAEEEYQRVVSALNQARAKLMTDIGTCVQRIQADLEVSLTRFLEHRLDECVTPVSKLEEVILDSTFPALTKRLQDEKWVTCRTEPILFSAIPEFLFRLERKEELLEPVQEECPWRDQYYCVPGNPVRMLDLTNYRLEDTNVNLSYVRGLVWTALADGKIFFCGNEHKMECMVIDKDYSNSYEVGRLHIGRSSPGLIAYGRFIYIFGGLRNNKCLNSIEKFSLKTNSSLLLFGKMNSPRAQFTPCIWKNRLILSPGIWCGSTEIFDPVTETCRSSINMSYATSSISLNCGEDEIVILSVHINVYDPKMETYETLTQDVMKFLNPGEVILHGEEYYFLSLLDDIMHICSLNKVSHEFTPILAIPSLSS